MCSPTCCLYLSILTIGFAYYLPIVELETSPPISAVYNIPEEFNFEAFLKKHGKLYGSLEETSRAKLFYSRTLDIYKANVLYATHRRNHYLAQNGYIDLSPAEMKDLFLNPNFALPTVQEAAMSPDTPADSFVAEVDEKSTSPSNLDDGFTRSTLSDLSSNSEDNELDLVANLFRVPEELEASSSKFDSYELFQQLSKDRALSESLSRMISIKKHAAGLSSSSEPDQKDSNVVFRPIIKPTNPDFDPSTIDTRGIIDNRDKYNQFYSNMMMDDFLGFLEPYPSPPVESASEIDEGDRGIILNFIDSLKNFRDMFAIKGEDELLINNREKDKLEEETPSGGLDESSKEPEESGIVYHIDWRGNGCVSRIKDQGKCNSCYAFAVLDLFEYFYCRQMGEATEFSAQYLVDCGTHTGLRGCQGGRLSSVKQFVGTYGLQVNSLYPYAAQDQTCPYHKTELVKASLVRPRINRWAMYADIKAWYKYIASTPIIVGINMPTDFLAYGGGIHDGRDCAPDMGHALLLVGAGKENGKPFWLLKNTFSEDWGEKGYFRLSRKAPIKCFESAVVLRVSYKAAVNQNEKTGVKDPQPT